MTTAPEPIAIDQVDPFDRVDVRPRGRRRLLPRFVIAFVLGMLAVLGVGVGALYAYDQQYQDRILPGVHVGTLDLSGLTAAEASARLHDRYDGLANGTIVLVAGKTEIEMPFERARRTADIDGMVAQALSMGRAGSPAERMIANVRTAVRGVDIQPRVVVDQDRLARWVTALAAAQHVSPNDAIVTRTKTGFTITPSVAGRRADPTAAIATLAAELAKVDAPARLRVDLSLAELAPTVTSEEADAAVATADRIAADIRIKDGDDSWTIPSATIRTWISFGVTADGTYQPIVSDAKIAKALGTVSKAVARPAQDAGLKLVGGHVVVTGSSREGRMLDAAGMKAAIVGEMAARQAGAAASPVAAAVTAVDPKLTTADAKAFAPKMKVISSFSVYYFVIVNNHWGGNIEAPATKINGTVVPPGGVFDFWKVVGDLRQLPGTGPGNAIEGGKITVTGAFGGGICTTSTTLFNAAFRAGMVPLARQNHNEFINRYPPGLDATVWIIGSTKQTMSFKNDTKYPILIQRIITNDGSRRWITFKIWSVPNGRTYTITNRVIQYGPRAIDTVVRDPTKPVGYYFRNNAPADGAKVWVTVSIYDRGTLHWSKRYFSNYPAVNGVTIIGTKPT